MRKTLLSFFAAAAAIICSSAVSATELKDKVVGDFTGNMVITITAADDPNGESVEAPPAPAIVKIAEDGGSFSLALNNFLFGEPEPMYVGNIAVSDITVTDGDIISISAEKPIVITAGDADFKYEGEPVAEDTWLGPAITEACGGSIPITLAGTIEGQTAKMTIDINAAVALNMIISVKFEGTNPNIVDISNDLTNVAGITAYTSEAGILYVKGLDGEAAYTIYNVLGSGVASGVVSDTIDISSLPKGIYILKVGKTALRFSK